MIITTIHILLGAIAPELDDEVKVSWQTFGLLCDESNTIQKEKELVILARIYDEDSLEIVTKFVDMPVCNIGTADSIFEKLETSMM